MDWSLDLQLEHSIQRIWQIDKNTFSCAAATFCPISYCGTRHMSPDNWNLFNCLIVLPCYLAIILSTSGMIRLIEARIAQFFSFYLMVWWWPLWGNENLDFCWCHNDLMSLNFKIKHNSKHQFFKITKFPAPFGNRASN